jgi:hypothetical protein
VVQLFSLGHLVADWLLQYSETTWDEKIAADARAGKLGPLFKKPSRQSRPNSF